MFCLLGAFQFVPQLRRGRPSWHRIAGRILVPAGIIAGLSGMWLAVNFPRPDLDVVVRLFFAALMVGSILLGLRAILRRDFAAHRAWMIRGYAIGVGAGTQVLTAIVWALLTGGVDADANTTVALMVAALGHQPRGRRGHHPAVSSMSTMLGPLRSVWTLPPRASPAPPKRVWRDWVLVAVLPLVALFEGLVRTDLPFAVASVVVVIALVPTLLWRRTHPLVMFLIAFGVTGAFRLVTGEELQLYTQGFLLLLVYAVFRWGSGRALVIGFAVMLVTTTASNLFVPFDLAR